MEDNRIVDLFLCRDETAITLTAEKYGKRLRTLALNITDDVQTAEECENDTYIQAWNSIPPHEPRDYLFAFLARITRHISLNRCRERSRLKRSAFLCEFTTEMEQCIPAPDDLQCRLDSMDLGRAINGFLATLNEEKRLVFLRRYWFLDSIEAIARRFSMSQSKVKTMLFRTRNHFRDYLEKEGYTL